MDTNIPEPLPKLGPNPYPLTKIEKIAIAGLAVAATAVLGLLVKNTLDIRVLRKHTDFHASAILSVLHTLEDQDIIQNLTFGE